MKEETKEKIEDWALDHLPGWMWRAKGMYKSFLMWTKHYFQKVFRKNHISDYDCWGLSTPLAKTIRRHLQAFLDAPRVGYPFDFSNWEDFPEEVLSIKTEEEYYKKYPGGGKERWNHYIREMIFAMDYALVDLGVYEKENEWFYKKYSITMDDFHKEKSTLWGNENWFTYMNEDVQNSFYERYEIGMKYFAKYFLNLWD